LSVDGEHDAATVALIAAACAISPVHWEGPIAAARLGHVNGELFLIKTSELVTASDLNLVVAELRKVGYG
jgi:polyribonucleotide nucleotidyltransferase